MHLTRHFPFVSFAPAAKPQGHDRHKSVQDELTARLMGYVNTAILADDSEEARTAEMRLLAILVVRSRLRSNAAALAAAHRAVTEEGRDADETGFLAAATALLPYEQQIEAAYGATAFFARHGLAVLDGLGLFHRLDPQVSEVCDLMRVPPLRECDSTTGIWRDKPKVH